MNIKYYKIKNSDLVFILVALFLLGFIAGIQYAPEKIIQETVKQKPIQPVITGERVIEMLVPAVDESGNGAMAKLVTRIRPAISPGYGMMLVSINDALAQYDTQLSARIAARAAEQYTGTDLEDFDIIYSIIVDASVIEGPSAGAAMAITVVAALENKTIADDVTITGTIEEDGKIGPAGSIKGKARASRDNNLSVFLVSGDLPQQKEYYGQRTCSMMDKIEYCEIKYVPMAIDISESLGITVKKVSTLKEALGYFII